MSEQETPPICAFCIEFTHKEMRAWCDLRETEINCYDAACGGWRDSLTGATAPTRKEKVR